MCLGSLKGPGPLAKRLLVVTSHALPVLSGVFAVGVVAGCLRKPMWPEAPRWQGDAFGIMAFV